MKPGFQKLNVELNYILSVAGRNLIFVSTFELHSQKSVFQHIFCDQHGKSAFLLQISFFCCFSIFLLSLQNAQNTQNVHEKHGYWWIIHGKLKVIFFFFQNVEADLRSCQISVIKVLVK